MEKFRMYNKKKLFEETYLLNRADSQGGSQGTLTICNRLNKGLWEMLQSQLSTVQRDNHRPTD